MTNINTWTIDGNLTADPTSFVPQNSQRFKVELRVAVNDRKKQGEQWVDDPSYFNVEIWGYNDRPGIAGWLLNNVRKGDYVACAGKAKWREFTDQQGNKREKIIMAADTVRAPVAAARNKGNGAPNNGGGAPAPTTAPGGFTPGGFTPGATQQQPGAHTPPPVIPQAMDPNLTVQPAAQTPPASVPLPDPGQQTTSIPVGAPAPALAGAGVTNGSGFQPHAVPPVTGNGVAATEDDIPF